MKTIRVAPTATESYFTLLRHLHDHDPSWMTPLAESTERALDGTDSFGSYATTTRFLCEAGGEPVAHAAAIVNPRLRDSTGAIIGQIGFFACIDDVAAAKSVLAAALAHLRAAGALSVLGPINGGAHRAHRFMTKGFETKPFLFEPRNPAYYPALFRACGFEAKHCWHSYEPSPAQWQTLREHLQTQEKHLPGHYRIDTPGPHEAAESLVRIHPLLTRMWAGHVGFTTLEADEFLPTYAPIITLTRPGHVQIARDESAGEDVGCVLTFPDYFKEVQALAGDASSWGSWLATTAVPRMVLHTIAIVPEVRRTGLAAAMIRRAVELALATDRASDTIIALVTAEWPLFGSFAPPSRSYALYERSSAELD